MTTTDPWSTPTIVDDRPETQGPQLRELPVAQTRALPGASYEEFVTAAVKLPNRREDEMLQRAKRTGELMGEDAFYSWRQAGATIEGASIGLAYALAQAWGYNITRVAIVNREGNRVHLRGVFVDLQNIAIVERDYLAHLPPAPGKYAEKPEQAERWEVMQLQAASSKAVRGAIQADIRAEFDRRTRAGESARSVVLDLAGRPPLAYTDRHIWRVLKGADAGGEVVDANQADLF
jgi:hypothetical protein